MAPGLAAHRFQQLILACKATYQPHLAELLCQVFAPHACRQVGVLGAVCKELPLLAPRGHHVCILVDVLLGPVHDADPRVLQAVRPALQDLRKSQMKSINSSDGTLGSWFPLAAEQRFPDLTVPH